MKKEIVILFLIGFVLTGCHTDFLDLKRDKKQVVPTKVSDFEAILDNTIAMNSRPPFQFALLGSDEYYVPESYWNMANPVIKNGYIWKKDIYEGMHSEDWNYGYRRILTANLALSGLNKIDPMEDEIKYWNHVKGTALFHRGYAYFCLAQLFAKQYDPASDDVELGIPLRLEPDPTLEMKRSNLKDTYVQILNDLNEALQLLPERSISKYRPSKVAAQAMLARVYLQIGDYEMALNMANGVNTGENYLLDYNSLDDESNYPFPAGGLDNPEIIFLDISGSAVHSEYLTVDTLLYDEYSTDDLRRSTFWEPNDWGGYGFRGSYSGGVALFTGLALDEIYLIRAECNARLGNLEVAIAHMNELLSTRYRKGTYEMINPALGADNLLTLVLEERKKQLVFRGLRWADLKRLNAEEQFQTTLTREIGGLLYKLEPNSLRYVWPIPPEAIDIGGLQQNPR